MWCSNCQQDVPLLGSPSGAVLRCGKCGTDAQGTTTPPLEGSAQAVSPPRRSLNLAPLAGDDWALEAELRGVQRLVASLKSRETLQPTVAKRPPPFEPAAVEPASAPGLPSPQPRSHVAAWLILSVGLAVFACGAVLLAWSLVGKREDLWPIGMPLTLLGQAGLILGLVLQLDGLWTTSRSTAAALNQLDGELRNVRQATTLLSTSHSGGAQSFYLHLAEGASPNLLLADLKGQMDLLAQQMARQSGSVSP